MKFADLHIHTACSDGTDSPEEVVKLAKSSNLSALAICDHDTIEGILPAERVAKQQDIEIIPSLELSAEHDGLEVHILGFLIEYTNPALLNNLKQIRENRIIRMYEMVDKLKNLNINIDIDKIFKIGGNGTIGRMHLARALKSEGYVATLQEAFYKYIGDNCPAYVSRFKLTSRAAIELILESKGVPVLAHPHCLNNDNLIGQIVGYGLLGIEVYYPDYSASVIEHYENIADKFSLIKTGGSDYHGAIKPQNPLGQIKVVYSVVEQLKDAKAKIAT